MSLLLEDRFAPITSEYGFIEIDCQTFSKWYIAWSTEILRGRRGVSITKIGVKGSLSDKLQRLEPLTDVEPRRFLLIPTRGQWTAYFDNSRRGTDAGALAYAARTLHCRAVRIVVTPDSMGKSSVGRKQGRYGATIFELYGPEPTPILNTLRSICAANDGGAWTFFESGELLASEDPSWYKARKIRDRFRQEHLATILRSLGIQAFDELFFADEGVLISRTGPMAPGTREFTLSDARQSMGL